MSAETVALVIVLVGVAILVALIVDAIRDLKTSTRYWNDDE